MLQTRSVSRELPILQRSTTPSGGTTRANVKSIPHKLSKLKQSLSLNSSRKQGVRRTSHCSSPVEFQSMSTTVVFHHRDNVTILRTKISFKGIKICFLRLFHVFITVYLESKE